MAEKHVRTAVIEATIRFLGTLVRGGGQMAEKRRQWISSKTTSINYSAGGTPAALLYCRIPRGAQAIAVRIRK